MRLQYILAEVVQGIRRNLSMTVAVILVTFISLSFVGAAALLQSQVNVLKDEWYDKVEVSVFLCPGNSNVPECEAGAATQEQTDALEADLTSDAMKPYVSNYWYESQAEAYTEFVKRFSDNQLTGNVTPDDMPASFRVKLVNPEEYEVIAEAFTGKPGVWKVEDQRKILEPLFNLLGRASMLAIGLAAVMLLASVLLINTTIRLSALSRRRETSIMRLVGASNLFIQLPFMLEGALAALTGAGLAIGGLWLFVQYVVRDWLASSMSFMTFIDTGAVWQIAPWLLAIALGIAAISSVLTLRKFTRV